MTINEQPQLDADILFRAVGDEGVVVDQRGPSVLVVNAVALRMLELLRAQFSVSAMVMQLAEEFDAGEERIAADVGEFLRELQQRGMLH